MAEFRLNGMERLGEIVSEESGRDPYLKERGKWVLVRNEGNGELGLYTGLTVGGRICLNPYVKFEPENPLADGDDARRGKFVKIDRPAYLPCTSNTTITPEREEYVQNLLSLNSCHE